MKRYILTLLTIFSIFSTAAFAAPVDPYAHLMTYDVMDKTFFEKLIKGEDLKFMVCVDINTLGKNLTEETANNVPLDSIDNWLRQTKNYIIKTKRQEEFKDILEIIEKHRNIEYISCEVIEGIMQTQKADLPVLFTNEPAKLCGSTNSCHFDSDNTIVIYSPQNRKQKEYIGVMMHELGHSFGLADQYSGATYKGSFLYNSKVKRPSIMDNSKKITCDDADGLITSIDRILGRKREFYSLCSDGVFIKDGKGTVKNNPTYKFKENYEYFDMEVQVSYDTQLDDSYIVDMTLTNFILSDEGLNFVKGMGFRIDNLKTLKNVQIQIHGLTYELPNKVDFSKEFKTPIGLWTLVLSVKKGLQLNQKQLITIDFYGEDETPRLTDLETNSSTWLSPNTTVPMVNFLPYTGYGRKEKLRLEFPFRFLKSKPKNQKSEINQAAAETGVDIGKRMEDILNNFNLDNP